MHKLMEFICDEMKELERKAEKDGKLTMQEVQYLDTLAHTKKNLLKSDEMWEDSEYSMDHGLYRDRGRSYEGGSYARNGRMRDRGGRNQYGSYTMEGSYARGGYSEDSAMVVQELRELMEKAPDEQTRMEFQKLIRKMEQM